MLGRLDRLLQGHLRQPIRQDRHTPGLDFEGNAQLFFAVFPFLTHGAAIDQYAHTFVKQGLPMLGIGMPQLHRGPVTPTVLVAFASGHRVVEIHIEPQQAPRLGVVPGELAVVGGGADIALTDEVGALDASVSAVFRRC